MKVARSSLQFPACKACSASRTTTMEVTRDEQYAALKFFFRLHKSSAEAYTMLQEAYGEFVLPYSTSRRLYKLFKDGRQSISKEGGPGAPVTALKEENSNAVMVREDRRITLMAGCIDIGYFNHYIMTVNFYRHKIYH